MKKASIYILITFLFSLNVQAQLMDGKNTFSRKDSLRGTLSKERINYDVRHYLLDFKIDIDKRYIQGKNKISFDVKDDLLTLQFDLFENMKITKVEWNNKKLKFNREYDAVFVTF